MSNEIVPGEASSWSDVLQELNLPKLVLGPAGEALSRLVGHVADVPAEYVKSFTQGIKDKREARSQVSNALAKAVAAEVATDRDLIQRAAQSFLAKELRSQTNKEAVAKKAIEHLSDDSGSSDPNPRAPEDDWLNVFERYAENASSEKLRDLWGRVLAKEIRKPKSFSLRTMRFVSELDSETARLFEKYSNEVINGDVISKPQPLEGSQFMELLELQDAGLLTGVDGNISQTYKNDLPGNMTFKFRKSAVHVDYAGPINVNLPAIMLTNVGKELLRIVDPSDELDTARAFAENFPHAGIISVKYGIMNEEGTAIVNTTTAWESPPSEAAVGQ
jgi:hypothetical protein